MTPEFKVQEITAKGTIDVTKDVLMLFSLRTGLRKIVWKQVRPGEVSKHKWYLSRHLRFRKPGTYIVDCAMKIPVFKYDPSWPTEQVVELNLKTQLRIHVRGCEHRDLSALLTTIDEKLRAGKEERLDAVNMLCAMDPRLVLEQLDRLAREGESVEQNRVAEVLAFSEDKDCWKVLIKIAEDGPTSAREDSLVQIGLGGVEGADGAFRKALRDEDPRIRETALRALSFLAEYIPQKPGLLSVLELIRDVERLTRDSEPSVRDCAKNALYWLKRAKSETEQKAKKKKQEVQRR